LNDNSAFAGLKIAFIGAGNMAEALVRGALDAGLLSAAQVAVADPSAERRKLFSELGADASDDNVSTAAGADIVVLAVKPQKIDEVLPGLAEAGGEKLFISIMAGVGTRRLAPQLGSGARVIRAMPNTPLLVGMGATGLAAGLGAGPEDMHKARALFEASGLVIQLHESELDAVTAVSGSGPAYVFYLAEAMIAAGRAEGLTPSASRDLVGATLRGAAELLVRSGESPEVLRGRVTSPGGTTQAAIEVLDSTGIGDKLIAAIRRAAERSRELGKQ
jgi:pyrroline-5-carboxylate reductase